MTRDNEEQLVDSLGRAIGFGRVMQLCESLWRKLLAERDVKGGGELTVGTCAGLLVPCQCVEESKPDLDDNGHCEWCCGTQRVTARVRNAQHEERRPAGPRRRK